MLRAFILSTRKLLVPRPLPVHTLTSDAASSSCTAIYDGRRSNHLAQRHRSILPLVNDHRGHPLLGRNTLLTGSVRCAVDFKVPDPSLIVCNMISMLKCVDLTCMKDSPPPTFWLALAAGGSQVVFPLLELIGGYCNTMTIFQLHLAAMTVGFLGGIKWGLAVSKNPVPTATWDTMKWAATPTVVALLGLVLPYPLGFLTIAGAMVSTLYLDLKSCAYPAWANAVRLFLTLTTLAGLFMALTAYLLFHNNENEKKKEEEKKEKKEKKDMAVQTDDEEEGEEKDKSKPKK